MRVLTLLLVALFYKQGHGQECAVPASFLSAVVVARPVPLRYPAAVQRPHEFRLLLLVLALYFVGQLLSLHLDWPEVEPPYLLRVTAVYRFCVPDCAVAFLRPLMADPPLVAAVAPVLVVALIAGQAAVVLLPQKLAKAYEIIVTWDWFHQVMIAAVMVPFGAVRLALEWLHRV